MDPSTRIPGSTRVRAVALVALSLVGLVVAACGSDEPAAYSGYRAEPPLEVDGVSLPLAGGDGEVAMPAPEGGLRIVYFGYTTCPDVCPTTMSDLRRALEGLPEDERERVEVAVVTVDPERDTPELLEKYVTNFVPDGDALRTTDEDQLRAAATAFGADYRITPAGGEGSDGHIGATSSDDTPAPAGEVEVAHTAELYAVDDSGAVVMQWPFGTTWENLQRDIGALLSEVR